MRQYGTNEPRPVAVKSLCQLVQEQLEDHVLRILIVSAFVALVLGVFKEGLSTVTFPLTSKGWIDGFAIIMAVFIIVSVSSVNNYAKELQFKKLMELREDRNVTVKRNGDIKSKNTKKLLVGDVMFVGQGDRLPVDSVLVSGSGLLVDESSQTGESVNVEKTPLRDAEAAEDGLNPFLLSGSVVKEGKGEAVVCAVGRNTRMGRIEEKLEEEADPTPLQVKLEAIVVGKCLATD